MNSLSVAFYVDFVADVFVLNQGRWCSTQCQKTLLSILQAAVDVHTSPVGQPSGSLEAGWYEIAIFICVHSYPYVYFYRIFCL